MGWISKETKKLIKEMSVGIVLYNLILAVLAFLLMRYLDRPVQPVMGGIAFGTVSAVLMIIHMGITTERTLGSGNEAYANKNTVIHSLLRKVIYVAVLGLIWYVFRIDLLAAIIASMGMKAGAYLQPWVHKAFGQSPIES